MSISLATMGKFNSIIHVETGRPPRDREYIPRPTLMVTSVHYTKKKKDDENPIKIIIKDVA